MIGPQRIDQLSREEKRKIQGARKTRLLSADDVSLIMSYDPTSGDLTWKHIDSKPKRWNSRYAGKVAGYVAPVGYRYVCIDDVMYLAHRVIWLLVTGEWPIEQIDHIDGNRANNKLNNLRQAACHENAWNQKMRVTNTSGTPGVSWDKSRGKWISRITERRKVTHIGYYDRLEDAILARKAAELKRSPEFLRKEEAA